MSASARLSAAIRARSDRGDIALLPYLTAGWPDRAGFADQLRRVAEVVDAIEVGIPFSDPMADGPVIQATSREALEAGVTLPWILETLAGLDLPVPVVLMGYVNPLLAYGIEAVVRDAASAGVCGFVVPDLPLEESAGLRSACEGAGLAAIQLVTPVTSEARLARIAAVARGFAYAVTTTGVTGSGSTEQIADGYLRRVREAMSVPVCAGFGIASAADVAALRGRADGAIVGTALLRAMRAGVPAHTFLSSLRGT